MLNGWVKAPSVPKWKRRVALAWSARRPRSGHPDHGADLRQRRVGGARAGILHLDARRGKPGARESIRKKLKLTAPACGGRDPAATGRRCRSPSKMPWPAPRRRWCDPDRGREGADRGHARSRTSRDGHRFAARPSRPTTRAPGPSPQLIHPPSVVACPSLAPSCSRRPSAGRRETYSAGQAHAEQRRGLGPPPDAAAAPTAAAAGVSRSAVEGGPDLGEGSRPPRRRPPPRLASPRHGLVVPPQESR